MHKSSTPAESHSREWLFYVRLWLLPLLLTLAGCAGDEQLLRLGGHTMGTSWSMTLLLPADAAVDEQAILAETEALLESVNASMSTYREDSEISRFNRSETGQWFALSQDFYRVLRAALSVGEQSGGAYDITVGPLVNLWGFGPEKQSPEPPTDSAIAAAMTRVGQEQLQLDGARLRLRKQTDVYLDLSSIAKGFAVDVIALYLAEQGIANFMVEVGGEMRLSGHSPRGDDWRIAIEQPDAAAIGIASTLHLRNVAVATSGDYRNFFEVDGIRYSHSIDPRTGRPVAHELVSVTVVHPSTMIADAWATALTVLGSQQALAVAQAQDLAVYLISRDGEGFVSHHTRAIAPYLRDQPARQGQAGAYGE